MVHHIAFHIDGTEWSCRTEVFALTAADTFLGVHYGYADRSSVDGLFDHLNGPSGTFVGAQSATITIADGYAVLFHPDGMTDMDGCFVFGCEGMDGTGGAHLAATGAFGSAIATLEGHDGLHQMHGVNARTQHIVGASTDAQLTGCAVARHVEG